MNLKEKSLSQEYKYKGRVISLRVDKAELPNGDTAVREVIEHNGGVCVAAITEDDEVLMVKQFRYPYMEEIYELPAGKRDGDEEPLICGKRELREETGAEAGEYLFIGQLYPSPGYCGEIISMYVAKDLTFGNNELDKDEFLVCEKMPLNKAVSMVLNGEIKDAKTQAALLKLFLLRQSGQF